MADISVIKLPNNSSYNIKDTTARTNAPKVNVTLGTTTKAYLLGTSTTPTATAALTETIADTGVYLDTVSGEVSATTYSVNQKVRLVHDTSTNALNFVFT